MKVKKLAKDLLINAAITMGVLLSIAGFFAVLIGFIFASGYLIMLIFSLGWVVQLIVVFNVIFCGFFIIIWFLRHPY